ncbi:MAG: hypothetical protein HYV40_06205 [Candidatus Levybacteria bacterium]|nr:hypothetical protein [Candidatus Levybacteria bacterium]
MSASDTKVGKVDPRVKDILKLLGIGTLLAAALVMPGPVAILLKEYERQKIEQDRKEWDKYNIWRLRQVIKRLEQQKVVELVNGMVKITEKGRRKLLRYDLNTIALKEKTDGKWRLIVYDVSNLKREQRNLFRAMLRKLNLLQLQKSVYLTPFICDDEIEYLRQIFDLGREVLVIKASHLENEEVYKRYFGL